MARFPIGANFDDNAWDGTSTTITDLANESGFDTANERGQRFSDEEQAARWALDLGIEDFTYIIDYEDGTYGVYVEYEG